MGPGPVEQNLTDEHGVSEDGGHEDDEGWHIGYEVEMHGVSLEEYVNSGEESSDTESDSCDENDRSRYIGYQTLPSSDVLFEAGNTDYRCTSTTIHKNFQETLSAANSVHLKDFDFRIEDKPKPIELTEDKIEDIKKAMTSFTLPAPSWAKGIGCDNELKKLLDKLRGNETAQS